MFVKSSMYCLTPALLYSLILTIGDFESPATYLCLKHVSYYRFYLMKKIFCVRHRTYYVEQ